MLNMIKEYKKGNLIFIELSVENLIVTLCNLAASIYSIYFNNSLMTKTLKYEEDFLNNDVYNGKTIGRSSNRIKGNKINISSKEYILKNNEGNNTLHGGLDGISNQIFDYEIINDSKVIFTYLSKNNESGFPGNLNISVIYEIFNNELECSFLAISDEDTICNLTNHTFFTLGEESLDNISLKVNANSYIETSKDELLPIKVSPIFKEMDFNEFKRITEDIDSNKINFGKARGYDHCFYLSNNDSISPSIFIKNEKIMLSIITDFECCQIYSDNYENEYKWLNSSSSFRNSIAIEPQDDFLNRAILKANQKYQRFIVYKFNKIN